MDRLAELKAQYNALLKEMCYCPLRDLAKIEAKSNVIWDLILEEELKPR